LSELGLDLWTIQLLGRWGSSVVQQYVEDASVGIAAANARRDMLARSLGNIARDSRDHLSADRLRELAADEVLKALRVWTPSLSEAVKASILPDLIAAATSHRADTDSTSDSSQSDLEPVAVDLECPREVAAPLLEHVLSSTSTCKKHRALVGPRDNLCKESWVTFCGWKFGSGAFRDPAPDDLVCRKCWP